MTQPAPPDDSHVLATAAIGYALISLEQRAQQQIQDDISNAYKAIAAAAILAASTAPATVLTGIALLSLPALHATITRELANARENVAATIEATYAAAAQLAHTKLTADLAEHDYTVPNVLPELGDTIDRILTDVDTMFGHAQTDIQNSITAAYDGITGDNPTPARVLAINQAIIQVQNRLTQRANAATTTAAHKGSNEAQQAIFAQYQTDEHPTGLLKRWIVTSATPCAMCAALDGTAAGVNADFDTAAGADSRDWRRPWRDMRTPPRHPNCRCQIQLVTV